MEDNYPGEKFGYLLGVYTGSRINSSTDANVGVKLMGENGDSRVYFIIKYYKTHLLWNGNAVIIVSNYYFRPCF